jgi:alkylation response protein AidB-like acyl-CoA dehydrogenase
MTVPGAPVAASIRTPAPPDHLDLLDDGTQLRSAARGLLASWDRTRLAVVQASALGYDAEIWNRLRTEIWPLVTGPAQIQPVLEEIGLARCPLPVHSGLVQVDAALGALRQVGAFEQVVAQHRKQLLDGSLRYAVGLHNARGEPCRDQLSVVARPATDRRWRLSGRARYVLYADSADYLVLPARVDEPGPSRVLLLVVPAATPGVLVITYPTVNSDRLSDVELTDVTVRPDWVLAGDAAGDNRGQAATTAAVQVGTVALAAELTGLAAGLLQTAVQRVRTRTAYGQPLAALQAVRQRAADMYVGFLAARDATSAAGSALAADGSHLERSASELAVAAAKVTATTAALRIATDAHQLCGGWGYLDEAGLHHYTRAIKAAEGQLGSPRFHRRAIAGQLLADRPK